MPCPAGNIIVELEMGVGRALPLHSWSRPPQSGLAPRVARALPQAMSTPARLLHNGNLLALRGADIIALPTNWPTGAESAPEYMVRARAFENRVFVIACNRTGEERGARYIGRSCIAGPDGRRLADASAPGEEIIYASIAVADARRKRLIVTAGEFEMDFINDRRPDLYG